MLLSVPEKMSRTAFSVIAGPRMMRGVIDSTISDLPRVPLWLLNSAPKTGTWPRPGTLSTVFWSWSEISPPRICVSPSRSRREVCALRVPIW